MGFIEKYYVNRPRVANAEAFWWAYFLAGDMLT